MGGAFTVIRYGAALYLAYLAFRLRRAGGAAEAVRPLAARHWCGSAAAGYAVTLSDPKTIVFYLALLPSLLDLRSIGGGSYLVLCSATVVVLLAIMTAYAALAARARSAFRKPRTLGRLHRAAAAIMAGTAVWTILRQA